MFKQHFNHNRIKRYSAILMFVFWQADLVSESRSLLSVRHLNCLAILESKPRNGKPWNQPEKKQTMPFNEPEKQQLLRLYINGLWPFEFQATNQQTQQHTACFKKTSFSSLIKTVRKTWSLSSPYGLTQKYTIIWSGLPPFSNSLSSKINLYQSMFSNIESLGLSVFDCDRFKIIENKFWISEKCNHH